MQQVIKAGLSRQDPETAPKAPQASHTSADASATAAWTRRMIQTQIKPNNDPSIAIVNRIIDGQLPRED